MIKNTLLKELGQNIKPSKYVYENIKEDIREELNQEDSTMLLEAINDKLYSVIVEKAAIEKILCIVLGIIIPGIVLTIPLIPLIFSQSKGIIFLMILFCIIIAYVYIKVVYYYCDKKERCTILEFILTKMYEDLIRNM